MTEHFSNKPPHPQHNMTWAYVAQYLQQFAMSAPRSSHAEIIETHISLVVLVDDVVYKLKKPVHFKFIDFSTTALRRQACDIEVLINQRLAEGVYHGVVPITFEAPGILAIGGQGSPVEWMVKMRRLPADKFLDHLIQKRHLDHSLIVRLARKLADFYAKAIPVPLTPREYLERTRQNIVDNRTELLLMIKGDETWKVKRIINRQLQFLAFESHLLSQRVTDHHIVDGHGDLRPEHVCMEDKPIIFDAIEFNASLRQIDAADELCFFSMECERLGASQVADVIWRAYEEKCQDFPPARLINFYKSYRATVRAKVALLRAGQMDKPQGREEQHRLAKDYLRLADSSLGASSQAIGLIFRGTSGTGKSTVAAPLAACLGMSLLQTDRIRRDIDPSDHKPLGYGEGHYGKEARLNVYRRMFELGQDSLSHGVSVIFDACFLSCSLVKKAASAISGTGALPIIVHCWCREDVAIARLRFRERQANSLSDAGVQHYLIQRQHEESDPETILTITLDTSDSTPSQLVEKAIEAMSLSF